MRKNIWLAMVLVLMLPAMFFFMSCAKNAVQSQSEQTPQPEASKAGATGTDQSQGVTKTQTGDQAMSPESAATAFSGQNIHFAFDSAVLSEQAQQILKSKADYLRMNPGVVVTVEGHCDDRGTAAYNMALGDRRAKSARDFLVNTGIDPNRFRTISYGEEQPLSQGHDEVSWAKNRRAQFVIQ